MIKFGIWLKDKLGIKFYSKPVYKYKYLRVRVREFEGIIKTNFLGNGVPKENMHYTCIACITIDSVMKMGKKYFPQVYLEECRYKIKKIQMSRFINTELKSDSSDSSDWETEQEYNTANCWVVLYMRVSGKFPYFYFFMKKFYMQKNHKMQTSNLYSDILGT